MEGIGYIFLQKRSLPYVYNFKLNGYTYPYISEICKRRLCKTFWSIGLEAEKILLIFLITCRRFSCHNLIQACYPITYKLIL